MENQKKIPRGQSSYANNVNFSHQQVQSASSTRFNNTNSCNLASFGHHKHAGHHQSDLLKTNKNKGRGYYGDRNHGNGKQKMAQQNFSNNGHQRERQHNYYQNSEVRGKEERSDKSSRHGESASHLLNFTYSTGRDAERGQRRGAQQWRPGKLRRQPVHTKEQFLQAHCQFVVKKSVGSGTQQLVEVDRMVDWDSIEQVILRDEQMSTCPICMEIPVAAKITKCAHIYCWPCMLHYLSLSDRAWESCPICADSVEAKDLKSVKTQALTKPKVGDEITFYLMKREREAVYVRPKTSWRASDAAHLFHPYDNAEDVRYSKLLTSTDEYIESTIREERTQLLDLLNRDDTESLEASFVQAALDSLNTRLESMGSTKRARLPEVTKPASVTGAQVEPLSAIRSAPNLITVEYADAFEEVAGSDQVSVPADSVGAPEDDTSTPVSVRAPDDNATPPADGARALASSANSPADGGQQCTGSGDVSVASIDPQSPTVGATRNRTISSNSNGERAEAEQLAADLVLPPTGTQPGHSSGSKRTEVYYFYQAADGQHVYLHSINTRVLAAEYGSLEMAPTTLTATIVESEENSMTAELRKRLKYLSHLPLYSQFSVCEVVLRPPIVSSACLAHFTEEINQRKKMRNRRQRTEARQYNKAQAEERRRMGNYPDMCLPLDSDRHFPLSPATLSSTEVPSLAEFAPLTPVSSQSEQACEPIDPPLCEHAVPGRQHKVPITTPYSFSQAMKGSSTAAVWPRVQSTANYSRSTTGPHSMAAPSVSSELTEGEDATVPSFKQSFSADFELSDVASLSVSSKQDNPTPTVAGGSKVKDKKRKKQLVLFSTSGQRAAP